MSEHTKGPWEWEEGQPEITKPWGGRKRVVVARVVPPAYHEDAICGSREAGANAAFIVRACNSHDDLLAAARFAYDLLAASKHLSLESEDARARLAAAIAKAEAR